MADIQIYINVQNSSKTFRDVIIGLEKLGFTKSGNSYAKGYIMASDDTYRHLSVNEKPSEHDDSAYNCGDNVELFLQMAESLKNIKKITNGKKSKNTQDRD